MREHQAREVTHASESGLPGRCHWYIAAGVGWVPWCSLWSSASRRAPVLDPGRRTPHRVHRSPRWGLGRPVGSTYMLGREFTLKIAQNIPLKICFTENDLWVLVSSSLIFPLSNSFKTFRKCSLRSLRFDSLNFFSGQKASS